MHRWFVAPLAALAFVVGLSVPQAPAQEQYPTKPIKIVVPYPPGGATDITARIFADKLTPLLGQQIVIENKPGAATNIAAEYVARSAADGYTLYVANFASHAVNRWLFSKLPFDPVADFTHVAMLVRGPMFLCLKPGLNFPSVKELVEYARKNPGKLTYGSTGNGSPNHISGELLKHLAKIDVVHVPYTGSAQLYNDLLAGQIDYGFDAAVIQFHRNGRLKCIGVASTFRWPTDPDLPPLAESGVPGFDLVSFFGIVGPKGLPQPIVEKLNAAFVEVAKLPEVAEKLKVTAVVPFPASLEETRKFLLEQDKKWAPIVKASGAKVD
ncbi:MAG TPA: tripartite tricarboxylate transporter substrate binding protein [Xanthobacteraceae bacterium]|nr:tripartite tricarboxylate transporter substrate binding protein [Xanthobacteraceae bacterium]